MTTIPAIRQGKHLIVEECPFCGETHYHGLGDGPRVSHCKHGAGVYLVREVENVRTREIERRLRALEKSLPQPEGEGLEIIVSFLGGGEDIRIRIPPPPARKRRR